MSKRKYNKTELALLLLGAVSTGIQLVRLTVDLSKNKKKKNVLDSDYEPDAELEEVLKDDTIDLEDEYETKETYDGGVAININDGVNGADVRIANPNVESKPVDAGFTEFDDGIRRGDNGTTVLDREFENRSGCGPDVMGGIFGSLFGGIANGMMGQIIDTPAQETVFQECTVVEDDKDTCLDADEEIDGREELVETSEVDYGEENEEFHTLNYLEAFYNIPIDKIEPGLPIETFKIESMISKGAPVFYLPVDYKYASIDYFEACKLVTPENTDTSISPDKFKELTEGKYPIKIGEIVDVIVDNDYINYRINVDDDQKYKIDKDSMVIFAYVDHNKVKQNKLPENIMLPIELISDAVYITGASAVASLYEYEVMDPNK